MRTNEIREQFISFFQERDHLRLPSASLIPASFDSSVLLTTAGMHPLMPYFLGESQPPHKRLTSVQKCFRTPDIDNVGSTLRHLTFFEMLGNFSVGDYFKAQAAQFAWELSLEVFRFDPEKIWITVFEGDDALGLGPDEEAIEAWREIGIPSERIVLCPRSENFWQAGSIGPCGPCSELYIDRGLEFGKEDDLPGGDNERFLEYWNLVFMEFNQNPENVLTPLPTKNIDTGMGLNRMASILQGTRSIFETDEFLPLIELGERLSAKKYGSSFEVDRSLRILADHTRGMSFLVADGVVPSNEERGYVLRRLMRRAIVQGRRLEIEPGFLTTFARTVQEIMGKVYPELHEQRDAIEMWLSREEEAFGRTIEQGTRILDDYVERALDSGAEGIGSEEAFLLHDTYGFPIDLTLELAAEKGLGVDEQGFNALMDDQRARARASGGRGGDRGLRDQVRDFARTAGVETKFTGYDATEQSTTIAAVETVDDAGVEDGTSKVLAKLVESPFYATGGGQIHDSGVLECTSGDCMGRVIDVVRVGDDQALVVEVRAGELKPQANVVARVDRTLRHATECNHTATHLLHAALRELVGTHIHQAGSSVQPEKLRFDFTHGQALSSIEVNAVEDRVNEWILQNASVSATTTSLDEARQRGAMALFGEKYGDEVRMVEIGDGNWSRELCGGTHVSSTAEIGAFKIISETSSAANVRRIEAITGPAAITLLRKHDDLLSKAAHELKTKPDHVVDAVEQLQQQRTDLEKQLRVAGNGASQDPEALNALKSRVAEIHGVRVLAEQASVPDAKALLALADRLKNSLGDAVIVLGCAVEDRVHLIVSVSPSVVSRGVTAKSVVSAAAAKVGGGGGGRDTMAQAGGRNPEKLPEALEAARAEIEAALSRG